MRPANSYIFRRRWGGRSAFGCTWKTKMNALLLFKLQSKGDSECGLSSLKDLQVPGCCRWNGWTAGWRCQRGSYKSAQTTPCEALPSPELQRNVKGFSSVASGSKIIVAATISDLTHTEDTMNLTQNSDGLFTFLILKHNLEVLTPVGHWEVSCNLQGLSSREGDRQMKKFITVAT